MLRKRSASSGIYHKQLNPLEILRKRFFKMILNKNILYPTDELYKKTVHFNIGQLYFSRASVYYYKQKDHLTSVDYNYEIMRSTQNLQFNIHVRQKK